MTWRVKLLYDGACPFCRREIEWLRRRDHYGTLATEDISDPAFDPGRYGLTKAEAMRALHGVLPDGRVVSGLEAVREAYRAIGLGWVVAPTGWPVLRQVCDHFYTTFARNRRRLGRLVTWRTGRRRGQCGCVAVSQPAKSSAAILARGRAGSTWIQDAERQPCYPHKKIVRRRGLKGVSHPVLQRSAGR